MTNGVFRNRRWISGVAYAVVLLLVVIHGVLILKTLASDGAGNLHVAIAGYGDIPFHLTQVSKFAFQHPVDFEEPIYAGTRLRYAFGVNVLSGGLLRIGFPLVWAVHIPSLLMMAGASGLLVAVYRRWLRQSAWAALAALAIFLLGSGWGAVPHLEQALQGGMGANGFVRYLTENSISTINKWNAVWPKQNIAWGAPLSLVFLHQRAFFAGIFFFSLFLWAVATNDDFQNRRKLVLAGLALGVLPLMHYHSFVVAGIVGVLLMLWRWRQGNYGAARRMFVVLCGAAVMALPQVIYLATGKDGLISGSAPFLAFRLGWMVAPTIGSVTLPPGATFLETILAYLSFAWVNFGIILPLSLVALVVGMRSRSAREYVPWMLPSAIAAAVLMVLTQMVRFQPWDYDNNKILVYWQLFAAPAVVGIGMLTWRYRRLVGIVFWALALPLMLGTGIIDQIPRLAVPRDRMPVIFSVDAQRMAAYIRDTVPPGALILTGSTHLNVVNSLAGRAVLVGYPGWLWTRGIPYQERERDLRMFYGDPARYQNVLRKYGARYVLVDPTVRGDWHANDATFALLFPLVRREGQYALYDVSKIVDVP